MREHDAQDDQPDGGDAEVADGPSRVGPNDREERAGEDEAADEQVGGLGATERDRDHDRQARDLEGHEVVARQVGELAPLDQGDRGDRPRGGSVSAGRPPKMATARIPARTA